jgi:hypothetical protein
MNTTHRPYHVLRSIGAVIAGALVGILLSIGTDALLRRVGIFPPLDQVSPNPMLALATAYRTLYGILGSYIAARLAPSRPMVHVMVLGSLGLVATTLGTVSTWNKGPAYGPHWYPIALIVLALPTAWVGGKLWIAQAAKEGNR